MLQHYFPKTIGQSKITLYVSRTMIEPLEELLL